MDFNIRDIPELLQQNLRKINSKHLKKKPLLKKNINKLKKITGRNNSGKITM